MRSGGEKWAQGVLRSEVTTESGYLCGVVVFAVKCVFVATSAPASYAGVAVILCRYLRFVWRSDVSLVNIAWCPQHVRIFMAMPLRCRCSRACKPEDKSPGLSCIHHQGLAAQPRQTRPLKSSHRLLHPVPCGCTHVACKQSATRCTSKRTQQAKINVGPTVAPPTADDFLPALAHTQHFMVFNAHT